MVKNRVCKSAISEAWAPVKGGPPPACAPDGAWADGGVGLCITGNVMIDRRALGEPGDVVIEDDSQMAELQAWRRPPPGTARIAGCNSTTLASRRPKA